MTDGVTGQQYSYHVLNMVEYTTGCTYRRWLCDRWCHWLTLELPCAEHDGICYRVHIQEVAV